MGRTGTGPEATDEGAALKPSTSPGGSASLYRRVCASVCAALVLLSSIGGCYSYVPVQATAPAPGTEVSVSITDRGRVELARSMGTGVRRLQGRLTASTDSTIVVSVSSVEYMDRAATVRWAGESVTLDRDVLAEVSERRLSRGRSWAAAGIVAAVMALVSTLAIGGFGEDPGDSRPPNGGVDQE